MVSPFVSVALSFVSVRMGVNSFTKLAREEELAGCNR